MALRLFLKTKAPFLLIIPLLFLSFGKLTLGDDEKKTEATTPPSTPTKNSKADASTDKDQKVDLGRVDDLLNQPFRVRMITKFSLDGSEGSQKILRSSTIRNEFVFFDRTKWRLRRELPFSQSLQEVLHRDLLTYWMTPSNREIIPPVKVSDSEWLEVLLAPVRLAEQWSLVKSDTNLPYWVDQLKKLKTPLQNADGDKITAETVNGNLKIAYTGKVIMDGNIRVNVEGTWELLDTGKVTETQLKDSLLRSI